jgi:hypothetical protein
MSDTSGWREAYNGLADWIVEHDQQLHLIDDHDYGRQHDAMWVFMLKEKRHEKLAAKKHAEPNASTPKGDTIPAFREPVEAATDPAAISEVQVSMVERANIPTKKIGELGLRYTPASLQPIGDIAVRFYDPLAIVLSH